MDLIANKKLPAWFNSEFSFLICIFSTFASPIRLDYASRMKTWLCVGSFHAQILPKYCYECCDICERLSVKFIGNTHLKQIYGLTNCSEKFFGRDNYVGRLAGFFAWHRVSEERTTRKSEFFEQINSIYVFLRVSAELTKLQLHPLSIAPTRSDKITHFGDTKNCSRLFRSVADLFKENTASSNVFVIRWKVCIGIKNWLH